MLSGRRVLAVVPARSGSRGIPGKNIRPLNGVSLIGRAGTVLSALNFIDARVISTDSPEYAAEGERYGLAAPFLRPASLSGDTAGAVETLQHAVVESERHFAPRFDIVLIVEPTSPLRTSADIERITQRLIDAHADSVVSVSPLSSKAHPLKALMIANGRLQFLSEEGRFVTARQALSDRLYYCNGIGYALTRECLMEQAAIFTSNSVADIITRPVANIDDAIDFEWAEFLMARSSNAIADMWVR